jgi:hypothetical protein
MMRLVSERKFIPERLKEHVSAGSCNVQGSDTPYFHQKKLTAAVAVERNARSLDSACRIAGDPACSARDDRCAREDERRALDIFLYRNIN